MKTFGKNFLGETHINPINRDLLLVTISGLLIALAIGTVAVMVVGQF
jgi:hypothetical protein